MADCGYKFINNDKINKVIVSMANNNISYGFSLSTIYKSDNFRTYVSKDQVANKYKFEDIPTNTLKRLLKEYYNKHNLDPARMTTITNDRRIGGFKNTATYNAARNYFADIVNELNFTWQVNNDPRVNKPVELKKRFKGYVAQEIIKRFEPYADKLNEVQQEEYSRLLIEYKENPKNIVKLADFIAEYFTTEYDTQVNTTTDIDPNLEYNSNFADLYKASKTNEFYEFCKHHSKVSEIFKDKDEVAPEDMVDESELLSDDDISVGTSNDEIDTNAQWNWGDVIKSADDLVSNYVRQRFNSLVRLTAPDRLAVDKDNPLGVASRMSYQEVSTELFNIIANTDAKFSLDNFIKQVYNTANNKKQFSSFIILYDEMINNKDFARKLYTDFCKNIENYAELYIDAKGNMTFRQSNYNNNSIRKAFYDIIDNVKVSASTANIFNLDNDFAKLAVRIKGDKNTTGLSQLLISSDADIVNLFNNTLLSITSDLQELYKFYMPDFDNTSIKKYIDSKSSNRDKVNAISNLYSMIAELHKQAKVAYAKYMTQLEGNINAYKIYKEKLRNYFERLGNVPDNTPPVYEREEQEEYTMFNDMLRAVDNISQTLSKYANIPIELNTRSVDGKNVSAVTYNNYLYNTVNAINNPSTRLNYGKSKFRSDQYKFSNILVDHGFNRGLFKYNNGAITPTNIGDVISVFRMAGISNLSTGANAKYNTMSDTDFMYYGFYGFMHGIDNYRKYNEGSAINADIPTRPFLLPVPSDFPRMYMLDMPVYDAKSLYGVQEASMNNYVEGLLSQFTSYIDDSTYNALSSKLENISIAATRTTDAKQFAETIISLIKEGKINTKVKNAISTSTANRIAMRFVPANNGTKGSTIYIPIMCRDNASKPVYALLKGELTERGPINDVNTEITVSNLEFAGLYTKGLETNYIVPENIKAAFSSIASKSYINDRMNNAIVDRNSDIFKQLKNLIYGEIQVAFKYRYGMFGHNSDKLLVDVNQLPLDMVLKKGEYIKDGKLIGNAFKFSKLFDILRNDGTIFSISDRLEAALKISSTGKLRDVPFSYTVDENNNITYKLTSEQESIIDECIENWIKEYDANCVSEFYDQISEVDNTINRSDVFNYYMNYFLFLNNCDDLFVGNSKFYKDTQTGTKRAKEYLAGGIRYSEGRFISNDETGNPYDANIVDVEPIQYKGSDLQIQTSKGFKPLTVRSAFKAVTIHNIVRPIKNVKEIRDALYNSFKSKDDSDTETNTKAMQKANKLAKAFGYAEEGEKAETTKTDDAQSYITIYEAIRRIKQLGEYPKYEKLIHDLLDPTIPINAIDPKTLNSFMQVAKNFYYDMTYDTTFNIEQPRQIKNAEFIIIPKLVEGTQLAEVHQWMVDNDIDQLNTLETSKAANNNVITLWNNEGELRDLDDPKLAEELLVPGVVGNFNYANLYRQQEVPQHITDSKNKAGVQIMKKIIDNLQSHLATDKNNFIENFINNIREDFNNLCDDLNIVFDEDYNVKSKNGGEIDFAEFNRLALKEMQRLGLDGNIMDYFTAKVQNSADGIGSFDTIMPEIMNIVGNKIENIAQSVITNHITRQKLPGFHATQITHSGLRDGNKIKKSEILGINNTENMTEAQKIKFRQLVEGLRYHPNGEPIIEIMIPRWTAELYGITEDSIITSDFAEMIGYRMPTEAKQSIGVLRVVGILPEAYGSTIAVPDAWVTQTGSDFDVDSIYGITFHVYKDKYGNIHKVPYITGTDEDSTWQRYNRYVNQNINRLIRKANDTSLTSEEKEAIIAKIRTARSEEARKLYLIYKEMASDLFTKENELYNLIADGDNFAKYCGITDTNSPEYNKYVGISKLIKNTIYKYLSNKNVSYTDRLAIVINYMKHIKGSPRAMQLFKEYADINSKIKDIFTELNTESAKIEIDGKSIFQIEGANKFKKAIRNRAKDAGLMTFEEFSKQTVSQQNTREARDNMILQSMINILKDPSNLEEQLLRSHFEDLSRAKEDIDELQGFTKVPRSPYNPLDQIFFRRNAMGGAVLKALSVNRDTGNSINNVSRTELDEPILIKYIDKSVNNKFGIDYSVLNKNYDVDEDGYVIHKGLGHSKNNRNIVDELITSYAAQTSTHSFDAVKEGAVFNENPYTFSAYRTLLDLGVDHHNAQLWLRQPAIVELTNAYFKTRSAINKLGHVNIINLAIRNIAKHITIDGKKLGNNFTEVNDYTPIDIIYNNIKKLTGFDFNIYENESVKLDMANVLDLYSYPVEDGTDNNILLEHIKQVIIFNKLNNLGKLIENHTKIFAADKYGAKDNMFNARKVFYDIYDLINNGKYNRLVAPVKGNKVPLVEAVYPGITNIAFTTEDDVQTTKSIDDIQNAIKDFLKYNREHESVYPILNAFFTYGTSSGYLITSQRFISESPEFIHAVKYLEGYLNAPLDEKTYNRFKKYFLNFLYFLSAPTLHKDVIVNKDGTISITENNDSKSRIYGYKYDDNVDFKYNNINDLTEEEYQVFHKLSPAQKIFIVKQHINSDKLNIFNYLKANLYHKGDVRKRGISGQYITFEDQNQNIDVIHELFEEAFNTNSRVLKDTMIDLIKYAFVVEGYNYGRNKVSKTIKNNALYESIANGGLNIIENIREGIRSMDYKFLEEFNIYEDFIRANSDIRQVLSHNIKYDGKKREIDYFDSETKLYYFNINDTNDRAKAKSIGVLRETKDNDILVSYINLTDKNKETILFKVVNYENSGNVFLFPLNPLDSNEYGVSTNLFNHKYIDNYSYLKLISKIVTNNYSINNEIKQEFKDELKDIRSNRSKEIKINKNVPKNDDFLENVAISNEPGSEGVRTFLRTLKNKFSNSSVNAINVWAINDILKNAFKDPYAVSEQVINLDDGNTVRLGIKRIQSNTNKFKKLYKDESVGDVAEKLKRNDITFSDDIYRVTRIKENDDNDVTLESSINFDVEIEEQTELGRINKAIYNDLLRRRNRLNDEDASRTIRAYGSLGLDFTNNNSIESNRNLIIKLNSKYYIDKAEELLKKINEFSRDKNGVPIPINHIDIINEISKEDNEEYRQTFLSLILECLTFGDNFRELFNLSTDNLPSDVSKAIEDMIGAITKIKNNSNIKDAVRGYYNNYISKFSNNPDIKDGFMTLYDAIITDETKMAYLFGDSMEINDAVTQVILKMIHSNINYADKVGIEDARKFNSFIEEIEKKAAQAGKPVNWNNIVDKLAGVILSNYNESFNNDKSAIDTEYTDTKNAFGNYHPIHLKAKRNRDLWYAKNIEQEFVQSYYDERNNALNEIFSNDDNIKLYGDYLRLNDNIKQLVNIKDKSDEQYNELFALMNQRRTLLENEVLNKAIESLNNIQEKYFVRTAKEKFFETRDKMLKIIEDVTYPNGTDNEKIPLEERIKNEKYREAVEWLAENTIRRYDNEFYSKMADAFSTLSNSDSVKKTAMKRIIDANPKINYRDAFGVIDGTKFTNKQVAEIKKEHESRFSKFSSEVRLIRNKPDNNEIYTEEFYKSMHIDAQSDPVVNKLINDINNILIHALDNSGKVYLSRLNTNQLKELVSLYTSLYKQRRGKGKNMSPEAQAARDFINENVDYVYDDNAIERDRQLAKEAYDDPDNTNADKEWYEAFNKLSNMHRVFNGISFAEDSKNDYIYSYAVPKDHVKDKFLDKDKIAAKIWINNNVKSNTTEYYDMAANKAKAEGRYDEWFEENHVYNPMSHKYEPIQIWTNIEATEDSDYKAEHKPNYLNAYTEPKPGTKNDKYKTYGANYNFETGDKKYFRKDDATEYEKEIRNYIIDKMKQFATNESGMSHVNKLLFPFRKKIENNPANFTKGVLNFVGATANLDNNRGISDDFSYVYGSDVRNLSMQDIYTSGLERLPEAPSRLVGETDEQYYDRIKEFRKASEEITKRNNELIAKVRDDDYKGMFHDYIVNAHITTAKNRMINDAYLLLEFYRQLKPAYQTTITGDLKVDRRLSTTNATQYKRERAVNTTKHLEVLFKRMFLHQYKPRTKFDTVINVMQNLTSAKYMMFNILGGVSNVLTGSAGIAAEYFAAEYFNHTDWERAKAKYILNSPAFLMNAYSDKSNNLIDAIFKFMNIIDYDNIRETSYNGKALNPTKLINDLKSFAYSPQTAGEHYMQNTALLALMYSNKIINVGGKYKIVDFNSYKLSAERAAIREIVKDNPVLNTYFERMLRNIKNDTKLMFDYQTRKVDIAEQFIDSLDPENRKIIGKRYKEIRDKKIAEFKKLYDAAPNVLDQFEIKDGYAKLKDNSDITLKDIAEFAEKAKLVNTRIHGVYNKLGAATIESTTFFGSLLMQFHKHIWNGILKHFRNRTYYNETLGTYGRGMYVSFAHLASKEYKRKFNEIAERRNNGELNGTDVIIAYATSIITGLFSTAMNLKFNYGIMNETDRANVRRVASQLMMTAYAFIGYIIAGAILEDDDDNLLANWGLYTFDRWSSETNMYNIGLFGEIRKFTRNPMAVNTSINEMLAAGNYILDMVTLGKDFDPIYKNGPYAGENKIWRYIERQVPIYRSIDRFMGLDKNNRYYKLGENFNGLVNAKPIIEFVAE